MVSTRLMAMALVVVWCCSTTTSEKNWNFYKPYSWMGSPKSYSPSYSPSYPAVYGKPQPRPYISSGQDKHRDRCELRKAVFTQDAESPQVSESLDPANVSSPVGLLCATGRARPVTLRRFSRRQSTSVIYVYFYSVGFQYIIYKTKIPDLKEFTLCHWHNIFNYTHDQPIFSYSRKYTAPTEPRWRYVYIVSV